MLSSGEGPAEPDRPKQEAGVRVVDERLTATSRGPGFQGPTLCFLPDKDFTTVELSQGQ